MKVLALNCGSSSLKFQLVEVHDGHEFPWREREIASGIVDRIGTQGDAQFSALYGERVEQSATASNHGEATGLILNWLGSKGLLESNDLGAVGHRVVHGGDRFSESIMLDDDAIKGIEEISYLAPLHNRPSLDSILAVRATLGPSIPQVAAFDTSFHHSLPDHASRYAIPVEVAERHHIRRYGFHGLAHRYMAERYSAITSKPLNQVKLITLQLGNGCSATGIKGGCSVDTSMGFTPLEGLIMGTRSGDLDPALIGFLMRYEGMAIEQVEDLLNKHSGLLGISGRSRDMRQLLEAEERGDSRAALAVEMFCYRVRKYIGAYLAILGGAQAVTFGGGIGENAPQIRARICAGMEWCGLVLDKDRNAVTIGSEGQISMEKAGIHAYVIPVSETFIIVHETIRFLSREKGRA